MYIPSPLDSASAWFNGSNAIYVAGAVLTFGAAIHVLIEKRSILAGRRQRESFWAEASVVLAAAVSVLGTIGAIHFGRVVSRLKDDDLAAYKISAGVQVEALKAMEMQTANENLSLRQDLQLHEKAETITDQKEMAEIHATTRTIADPKALRAAIVPYQDIWVGTSVDFSDHEAYGLRGQLSDILLSAKMNLGVSSMEFGAPPGNPIEIPGVHIAKGEDAKSSVLAHVIETSLRKSGIAVDNVSPPEPLTHPQKDWIYIFVGPNPNR